MSGKSTAAVSAAQSSLNSDKSGLLQRKCDCGNAAGLTGKCSGCQQQKLTVQRREKDGGAGGEVPPIVHEVLGLHSLSDRPVSSSNTFLSLAPLPIQPKLTIGQPNDRYEQEADRVADRVMRMPALDSLARVPLTNLNLPLVVQRQEVKNEEREEEDNNITIQTKEQSEHISLVIPALEGHLKASQKSGQPLPKETRTFMELRFGQDFSRVRVHTNNDAVQMNRELGSQAFTHRSDIYFGSGKSPTDKLLLAHELTHVIQQHASPPRIQRKPNPQPSSGVKFKFSVSIDSVLDSDQLLLEFIKQYRRLGTDAEAAALRDKEKWHWVGSPPSVKQTDVNKGYILIPVNDLSIRPGTEAEKKKRGEYLKELSKEQQAAIDAEVDRQFWEKTHYRAGQKLGTSADDKQMAQYWKVLRDELIRKRQAIDALPLDIQKFLFDEKASSSLDPKDFETVLRIASKVAALTPAELAEYKSRVTAKTSDLSIYEASVDRFLSERSERKERIDEALKKGWRQVRELDEATLVSATEDQRLKMLTQLIQAYWTGGKEEESIIRIISTTPSSQAKAFVNLLTKETINDKSYLDELDRVVDFGNNLELHAALSKLRIKAMGSKEALLALTSAPILPWHDIMGFFEDDAVFSIRGEKGGGVWIKYPVRVMHAKDFGDEPRKLPGDIFLGGHLYEPNQVLIIHDYDQGRFVPVVAQELAGYEHAGIRGFLGHVATVATLPLGGVGGAATNLGVRIAIRIGQIMAVASLIVDENRLNIVKWFPKWGTKMLYYFDLVNLGVNAFGIAHFLGGGGLKLIRSWKQIRQARKLLGEAEAAAEAEKVAVALEKQVDELFTEAEQWEAANQAKPSKEKTPSTPQTKPQAEEPSAKPKEPTEVEHAPAPTHEAGVDRALETIQHAVCGFCFPAGTKLLTRDGYTNIEAIQPGDWVLTRDELLQSGSTYKRVLKTFQNITDSLIEITISSQKIKTTPGHVWWIEGKGWILAQDLAVGDLVLASDNTLLPITAIRRIDEFAITYNCEVEDCHTYFVAADEGVPGIWVHNQSLGVRVLRPDQIFQLIMPEIVITDRAAIRQVIGASLEAKGNYSTELRGLFAYVRQGRGAGFQGVTEDAINRMEVVLGNLGTKGGGVVAAIDLKRIGANRVFELSDRDVFNRVIKAYPRFENMFSEVAREGVVAVRGKIPARAVQSLVNIPESLSAGEKQMILQELLKPCKR